MTSLPPAPVVSIVDNDKSVRVATTKLLRLAGFAAHSFASAEAFLQSPRVLDTSCLITDVRMPGMSGVELQGQLIAEGRHMPVIFITAYPEENSRATALAAGAVGFLSKPFDGYTLIDCLRQALRQFGPASNDQDGAEKD
jgi:FixJ family two-component response regulator